MPPNTIRMVTMFLIAATLFNLVNYALYLIEPSHGRREKIVSWRIEVPYKSIRKSASSIETENSSYATASVFTDIWDTKLMNLIKNSTKEDMSFVMLEDEYTQKSLASNIDSDYFTKSKRRRNIQLCPDVPPDLGPVYASEAVTKLETIEDMYTELQLGGLYKPKECHARQSVAVIVPYNGTKSALAIFLYYMHPFLMKQKLEYQIFVVNTSETAKLNNFGRLYNIGVKEAIKRRETSWGCLVLHSMYLLPMDTRNLYRCSWYPRQLLVATEIPRQYGYDDSLYLYDAFELTFNYLLKRCEKGSAYGFGVMAYPIRRSLYKFGGVVAMTPEQFAKVNGFSNDYRTNATEFKELYKRILAANFTIERSETTVGNYTNVQNRKLGHDLLSANDDESDLSPSSSDDGYSSLSYKLEGMDLKHLYTHIQVDMSSAQQINNNSKITNILQKNYAAYKAVQTQETTTESTEHLNKINKNAF